MERQPYSSRCNPFKEQTREKRYWERRMRQPKQTRLVDQRRLVCPENTGIKTELKRRGRWKCAPAAPPWLTRGEILFPSPAPSRLLL
ncbi:hypothetical protein MRX96_059608 [Rhipicephalus microplus]